MDSAPQWTQDFGVTKSMADLASSMGSACSRPALMDKKVTRPPKDQALNCPRCHSTNTKFCYYNNYSLTQPRYFCKTCRRYWTEGGTLRNVPVGGGSRKHKKSISATNSHPSSSPAADQLPFSSPKLVLPDLNPPTIPHFLTHHQNPKILEQGRDLNLGFQGSHDYNHGLPRFLELSKMEGKDVISSSSSSSGQLSALSFMENGKVPPRELNSFFPNGVNGGGLDQTSGNAFFGPGFLYQECKPSLAFSIDRVVNGLPKAPEEENSNGTLMFAVGETKRDSSTSEGGNYHQDKGSNENTSNGFWNGMLGGGSW